MALRKSELRGISIPGQTDRLIASLFADDTTVFLSIDDDYAVLSRILEAWCKASRAKFNIPKTIVIPLGSAGARKDICESRTISGHALTIPLGTRILRDGEDTRILGARLGNATNPSNHWMSVVEKVRCNLNRWAKRRPTLHGKRLVVNMEVGGRTQFLTMAQGMPADIENELQKIISDFIWSDETRPLINREFLHEPINRGGL
ncbi:hypothetical protein FKP32DRAFT_1571027, partial [Trametes sanguinea]